MLKGNHNRLLVINILIKAIDNILGMGNNMQLVCKGNK